MTFDLGLRLRLGLLAVVGFMAAGACATETYLFVDSEDFPPHCSNGTIDTDLGETALNCGGDCQKCQNGEGCLENSDCAAGMCLDLFCQSANCDNGERDGDESDEDCGGGCKPCETGEICNSNDDCVSELCTSDGICAEASCTDTVSNGDETGVDCGGVKCSACPAGSPCLVATDCISEICNDAGVCSVKCREGWDECDGDTSEECETNLLTDTDHCGACAEPCSPIHALGECIGGTCQIDECEAPYEDCDNYAVDGCEVNLSTDLDNCGACGMACSDINGTPSCVGSECRIDCADGFGDCNGNARDGCEKAVTADVKNCSGCGDECPEGPGETAFCDNGVCGASICPAGFGNCNAQVDDECEQDLLSSVEHCGSCGNLCVVANGTAECVEGVCVVAGCSNGFGNCNAGDADGGYADGCEMNTNEDVSNCGQCGTICNATNGTPDCKAGDCAIDCATDYADCDGNGSSCETHLPTSKEHCGSCTSTHCDSLFANATGLCRNSRCEFDQCQTDFDDCDGAPENGCEEDLRTSEAHCRTCGRECSDAGTTTNECVERECQLECASPFLDCDEDATTGCEINGAADTNNCGACDTRCSTAGAMSTACTDDGCVPVCTATHQNCDGSGTNGCESEKATDEANCGACGTVCGTTNASGTTCSGGVCNPTCNSGWGKCTDPAAGCTDSLNTPQRCGSCGNACGGSTPYCVNQTCGTLLVNSGTVGTGTGSLSFNHSLATGSGQNRMVLLALAALNTSSAGNATPTNVTYGGGGMTLYASHGSSGIYTRFYYRLDSGLGSGSPGARAVQVTLPSGGSSTPLVAEVLEFKGIHQTNPIEALTNGGGGENFCNGAFSNTILVPTKGAYIYSFAGLEWGQAGATGTAGLTKTFQLANTPNLNAVGGYIAAANAVNYTVGWTSQCSHYTHQVIALRPVTALP